MQVNAQKFLIVMLIALHSQIIITKPKSQYSIFDIDSAESQRDTSQKVPARIFVPQGNKMNERKIRKALLQDDAFAIKELLSKREVDFNQPLNEQGETIVHKAVYNNAIKILTFLISNELPPTPIETTIKPTKKNLLSSFDKAFDFAQSFQFFDEHDKGKKAKIEPKTIPQTFSNTLDSCKNQVINFTNKVVKSATRKEINLDAQDINDSTALHAAMILHRSEMIKILVAAHVNQDLKDKDGYTPLQLKELHAPGSKLACLPRHMHPNCTTDSKSIPNRGCYSDEEFQEIHTSIAYLTSEQTVQNPKKYLEKLKNEGIISTAAYQNALNRYENHLTNSTKKANHAS